MTEPRTALDLTPTFRRALLRRRLLVSLVVAAMFAAAPKIALCEADWLFTLVEPGMREHDVTKGVATIKIDDSALTGTMRSKEGVEYKLTGTLSKGRIKAKFTVIGSEVLDMPLSGTYVRKRYSSRELGIGGLESIVLTNGITVVAIERAIP